MTLFLRIQERYQEALKTFDPLQGTWILNVIDPIHPKSGNANPHWLRIILFISILFVPVIVCCSLGNSTFGGMFYGAGSLTADISFFSILLFLIISATLIPIARRIIGSLINELFRLGVVDDDIKNFDPSTMKLNPLLRILERLSRVNGYCGFIWFLLMLTDQVLVYRFAFLDSGIDRWATSDIVPGSAFYFMAGAMKQPNIAGLWQFIVVGPIILFLMIVIARLVVVFACLCVKVSDNPGLNITPAHPDGSGGLNAIGQTALFLSLFTFALGLDLAGITLNEIVVNRLFIAANTPVSENMKIQYILWILYFIFGTLLFLLPLIPLRKRLAEAKRKYMLEAIDLHTIAERAHRKDITAGEFNPNSLQGLGALDGLFRAAHEMAVWPFDSKTAIRYGSLLISPFAPIVADQIPNIFLWIKTYLGMT
jgi:hypothetical protein